MGQLSSSRVRTGGIAFCVQGGWDYDSSSFSCCFYKLLGRGPCN